MFPEVYQSETYSGQYFELTADEMERIRALDKGVRFFNMSLSEQEAHLSAFTPAD